MRQASESGPSASRKSVTAEPQIPAGLSPAAQAAFGFQQVADGAIPRGDIASFIAEMLADLRVLADKSGLDSLARFIEIAEREAKWRCEQNKG